jgi:hypothetical protein
MNAANVTVTTETINTQLMKLVEGYVNIEKFVNQYRYWLTMGKRDYAMDAFTSRCPMYQVSERYQAWMKITDEENNVTVSWWAS